MQRHLITGALGYLFLVAASCLGALFHYYLFPDVVEGAGILMGNVNHLPKALQIVSFFGFLHYCFPLLFLLIGSLSLRWKILQSSAIVGFLSFNLCLAYLIYAFALSTPAAMLVTPLCEPCP